MNWEAVGALAELLGAISVFVTLLYLTIQVRQNSKALDLQNQFSAAQIMQSRTDAGVNAMSIMLSSEKNLDTALSATNAAEQSDFYKLDSKEYSRLSIFLSGIRFIYENHYEQYRQGFLSEDFYLGTEPMIAKYAPRWLEMETVMSSQFKEEVLRIHKKYNLK